MPTHRHIPFLATTALLLVAATAHAAAIPDPGDYTGLPPGTDLALLYTQNIQADQLYASGNRVALPKDLGLKIDVGIFRYVHYMQMGGIHFSPQVIVPFGQQKVGLSGAKSSGLGDILFGGTLWTIADMKGGEHLGFTALVTAPTGADKDKGYAISDNRWALELEAGYSKRFAPKWTLDLVLDSEFYQNRRDTGAKKAPMLLGVGHLRYHLSDATYLATSLRYTTGAKESLGGTTLSDRKNDTNLMVTVASFVTPQVQLMAQFAKDLRVESGPKTQAVRLRALYVF